MSTTVFDFDSEASLENRLGILDGDRTPALGRALNAAREIVSGRVSTSRVQAFLDENGRLPAALDEACGIIAAQIYWRPNSTYGVEAFAVGGDSGPGFLTTDPTVTMALERWRDGVVGTPLPLPVM